MFLNFIRSIFTQIQPFVVVFNSTLGLIIGGMTLYLLIRTRPRKVKSLLLQPGSIIINWSGHPLPEAYWTIPFKVWNPDSTPYFNVKNWETIQESVRKLVHSLSKDLQLRLMQGDPNIIIVIPQLAVSVSLLLATVHGLTGTFPTITSPLRKSDGSFWLPEPLNLSKVRLNTRAIRANS